MHIVIYSCISCEYIYVCVCVHVCECVYVYACGIYAYIHIFTYATTSIHSYVLMH